MMRLCAQSEANAEIVRATLRVVRHESKHAGGRKRNRDQGKNQQKPGQKSFLAQSAGNMLFERPRSKYWKGCIHVGDGIADEAKQLPRISRAACQQGNIGLPWEH